MAAIVARLFVEKVTNVANTVTACPRSLYVVYTETYYIKRSRLLGQTVTVFATVVKYTI